MLSASSAGDRALPGIDISRFQQAIDWTAVASSGIQYCYIKATEGVAHQDAAFAGHWRDASAAGLPRGAYHFFRPSDPVTKQADFFMTVAGARRPGDLPPVLDLEAPDLWSSIPHTERAAMADEWLNLVAKGMGATPVVYLSPAFATDVLKNSPLLASYPVWLAEYRAAPAPNVPKPWTSWTFWQYTNRGKAAGIAGFVDCNWFNGTLEQLSALRRPYLEGVEP